MVKNKTIIGLKFLTDEINKTQEVKNKTIIGLKWLKTKIRENEEMLKIRL